MDEIRHIIRLNVAEEYLTLLRELEIEPNVLDLNLLHDAYQLQIVVAELEKAGYDNGYLTTDSGLTVSLSRHAQGSYCIYAPNDGDVTAAAAIPVTAGSACSQFQAFPFTEGDYGFYAVAAGDKTYLRHPYLPADGACPDVLLYACVTVDGEDPVEACYQTIRLYTCADREEVDRLILSDDLTAAYGLQEGEGKTVYVSPRALNQTAAAEEYGFRLVPIA